MRFWAPGPPPQGFPGAVRAHGLRGRVFAWLSGVVVRGGLRTG